MVQYPDAKADFTREVIQNSNFDDTWCRDYVETLLTLERYIINGPSGWADSKRYSKLRHDHPEEFDILQRELKPEAYEKRLDEEWNETREDRLQQVLDRAQRQKEEQKLRKQWKRVATS